MKTIYFFLLTLLINYSGFSQHFQKTEERTLSTSDIIADAFCFLAVEAASKATLNVSVPFLKQHLIVSDDGHIYRIITQVNEVGELVSFGFEASLKSKFVCHERWLLPFDNCVNQLAQKNLFSKNLETIYIDCFLDRLQRCQ